MNRAQSNWWQGKDVGRLITLLEDERRYYVDLVAALPVCIAVLSPDRKIAAANHRFCTLFGLRTEEMGQTSLDELRPTDRDKLIALFEKALRDGSGIEHLSVLERLFRVSMTAHTNWKGNEASEVVLVIEDLGEHRGAGRNVAK